MNNSRDKFCSIVRKRSEENAKSVHALNEIEAYGQIMSVLRQELDSMVRCIYILNEQNISDQEHLIEQTILGERWRNRNNKIITDREMVNISNNFQGWTKYVYDFGCAFIHLSDYHNYDSEDPFESLEEVDKSKIKYFMNWHHGYDLNQDLTFESIKNKLVNVFEKVNSNLECYIINIENGERI